MCEQVGEKEEGGARLMGMIRVGAEGSGWSCRWEGRDEDCLVERIMVETDW